MNLSSIKPPLIQEADCKIIPNHEFFDIVCTYKWLDFNYQQMSAISLILLIFIVFCAYTFILTYQHKRW